MEMLPKVAGLLVLCTVVIAPHAEAAITCGQVTNRLLPCLPYLRNTGPLTAACCNGVKGVNSAAQTTPDRQAACRCLVSASKAYKVNLGNASKLPGLCGVSIPYQIGPNTDCSKVR